MFVYYYEAERLTSTERRCRHYVQSSGELLSGLSGSESVWLVPGTVEP